MKLIRGAENFPHLNSGSVVTLGVFDGVHIGHQQLIKACRQQAVTRSLKTVVFTFDPHPVRLLSPQSCPPLLNTLDQKQELLSDYGLDFCVVQPFTRALSHLSPEAFVIKILKEQLQAKAVVVGYNFTFGQNRSGTIATLQELGKRHGLDVTITPAYFFRGLLISSTLIRQKVRDGEVGLVRQLLKRPYFIEGRVIRGDGLGRQLGFPTANLQSVNELLPGAGVYATKTVYKNKTYLSVTNIGIRPTLKASELRCETYVMDFNKSLYDQTIRVEFYKKLRSEKTFKNLDALKAQIAKDITIAKKALNV